MPMNHIVQPRRLSAALLACTALLWGCSKDAGPAKPAPAAPPTVVDVIVTAAGSVSSPVEVNGEIAATEYVELHPEVSGRLSYLNVPEGAQVAQGTVIARVNDADLQAQARKLSVQIGLARQTERRLRQLLDINGVNQADYDDALGRLQGLEADSAYNQALIDKTVVRAPFSGRLGLRLVSPGAYVTPATTIASLQQVAQLKVDFTVPEQWGAGLKPGDTVQVLTDAAAALQPAVIAAVEPQVLRSSRNIRCRALLLGGEARPGAFAKVHLKRGASQAILIPTNAIIPDAMSKKVVTVKGGKAKFVSVETGERHARFIEVVSGLQPGDSVVVDGVLFARPDAPLQVRAVKQLQEIGVQ